MILDKKQMTEEDIKLNYITPAINRSGWVNGVNITMETKITDGRINLRGNMAYHENPKKVDYLFYLNKYHPIAVVEAKDNTHTVGFGMQQAMTYAQMLGVPFAYSSNGDAFLEHDFLTGQERQIAMDAFPSQGELLKRYQQNVNDGKGLNEEEKMLIEQPYYSSPSLYSPRYYQRNAVNRTLDAIARGQNQILLVMATGTGKTYTAFQIVYRLLKAGSKRKFFTLRTATILPISRFSRILLRSQGLLTRLTLQKTAKIRSLPIRSILLSTSNWSGTTIRSTTVNSLIRNSSISSLSMSVIVALPRRTADGAGFWTTSVTPPRSE